MSTGAKLRTPAMEKLPIGMQTFRKIREQNYVMSIKRAWLLISLNVRWSCRRKFCPKRESNRGIMDNG